MVRRGRQCVTGSIDGNERSIQAMDLGYGTLATVSNFMFRLFCSLRVNRARTIRRPSRSSMSAVSPIATGLGLGFPSEKLRFGEVRHEPADAVGPWRAIVTVTDPVDERAERLGRDGDHVADVMRETFPCLAAVL